MSRLFGVMCNEPEHLKCALVDARDALTAEGAPDGWGLAFFQGGEVLLQRNPKPVAGDVDFYTAIRDLRTDYVVGHVRDAGGEKAKLENTQPFRFRTWVFAHSGKVESIDVVRKEVVEFIPDFLRRNIRGETDSEYVFHLFLAFLHDAGKLDDPNISIADAASALRASTAMVDRLVTGAGSTPGAMNVVVANGRVMLAMRRGRPMHLRHQHGISDCRVCRLTVTQDGQQSDRRRIRHEHLRSVLVASEPRKASGPGWQEVPEGTIVAIARDLSTQIQPLREA
jgi:predicted glutamine amidotransferase